MSKMEFTDGVVFNLDGPRRVERRHDGYYIVGKGMLCPVDSALEGYKMITEMNDRERARQKKGTAIS